MKTNGNLKHIFSLIVIGLLLSATGVVHGGNKWMMDKNAGELLLINEQLINEIAELKENGVVEIEGRVVIQNGQPVLKLDKIRQLSLSEETAEDEHTLIEQGGRYKAFIREEPLDEVPILK